MTSSQMKHAYTCKVPLFLLTAAILTPTLSNTPTQPATVANVTSGTFTYKH